MESEGSHSAYALFHVYKHQFISIIRAWSIGTRLMGINGLLPLFEAVTDVVHISAYKGKTIAVDASSWLYKGRVFCDSIHLNYDLVMLIITIIIV